MALQKSLITGIGIEVTYHVITAIHWYTRIPSAHIDVSSYVSQTVFSQGYNPIEVNQFEFKDAGYPFNDHIDMSTAYNAILTTEKFQGATII